MKNTSSEINTYMVKLKRKILIMGLPGSGKTTLAELLVPRLKAVWFNADAVRQEINKDLGFDENEITVALTNIEPENTALDHVKPLVVPGNNGLS